MNILIGADLVPTVSNFSAFKAGDAVSLVGEELLDVLNKADYRIFNLEVPLCDNASPIDKHGPALIAPTDTISGYKALDVDLLALANNHIMDQDKQGLVSTIRVLNENGISYLGAGETLEEAKKAYFLQLDGKKIGVYACAEHEFSIAEDNTSGANPFDPLESLDHIYDMKRECDYVIVLYHGGKEHYRYPSPSLQKTCRKMIEKGADLVVCQHSHCVGCEEKYRGGTIVYGQGNFVFDYSESEFWQTSLLVQIGEDFGVSYIPLVKKGNGVRLADSEESKKIFDAFSARSSEIADEQAVKQRYEEYANEQCSHYLFTLSGIQRGFIYRAINKLSGHRLDSYILQKKFGGKNGLAVRNFFECEAHRELILQRLKSKR